MGELSARYKFDCAVAALYKFDCAVAAFEKAYDRALTVAAEARELALREATYVREEEAR